MIATTPRRSAASAFFSLADIDLSDYDVFSWFPDLDGWRRTRRGSLRVRAAEEIRSVAVCPATDFPGDDHEFIEATAANLAAVLETGLPQAPNVAGDAFPLPVAAYTKSPPSSRAADLEQVLLHGQHGTGEEDNLRGKGPPRLSGRVSRRRAKTGRRYKACWARRRSSAACGGQGCASALAASGKMMASIVSSWRSGTLSGTP